MIIYENIDIIIMIIMTMIIIIVRWSFAKLAFYNYD